MVAGCCFLHALSIVKKRMQPTCNTCVEHVHWIAGGQLILRAHHIKLFAHQQPQMPRH